MPICRQSRSCMHFASCFSSCLPLTFVSMYKYKKDFDVEEIIRRVGEKKLYAIFGAYIVRTSDATAFGGGLYR